MAEKNRYTDTYRPPHTGKPLPLPIIDWKRIGYSAPLPINGVYDGPSSALPKADVAVLTWTTDEWSAFDHVFLNSSSTRDKDDREWEYAWHTYSTAGGARESENLGDVIITNSGTIRLKQAENLQSGINNKTFKGKAFPSTKLFSKVQKNLFFDMASVATWPMLESMLQNMQTTEHSGSGLTVNDLVNPPLDPKNLTQSRIVPMEHTPLLTTDYYYIAEGNDAAKFAVLEMDDSVIAWIALQKDRHFAFARNISDPIVPSKAKGKSIPNETRGDWSSEIYQNFGFYTSFNGALATWAAITAM